MNFVDNHMKNVDTWMKNVDKYLFSGDKPVERCAFTLLWLC
jgi:hypothetical protein